MAFFKKKDKEVLSKSVPVPDVVPADAPAEIEVVATATESPVVAEESFEPVPVHAFAKEELLAAVTEVLTSESVKATSRTWLYHKDLQPRLFDIGEEIPEGYTNHNTANWYRDPLLNFAWQKPASTGRNW